MNPLLSILIPTVNGREHLLGRLLEPMQMRESTQVEILIDKDNKEVTIGEKRNRLVSAAKGLFSCFIDDDDQVHPMYIQIILDAIKENTNADCIGFRGQYFKDHRFIRNFVHTIECTDYTDDKLNYYRPPNHLNPIRTDITKRFPFPHKNMGEDTDWAMTLQKAQVLKVETMTEQYLYKYLFVSRKFY